MARSPEVVVVGKWKDEVTKGSKKTFDGLKTAASAIGKYGAIAFGAMTAAAGIALREYGKQEQAEMQLVSALKIHGQYSDELVDSMKRYASARQSATKFADEEIIQAQALMVSLGVQADMLERTTSASLDLAAVMGGDLQSAAMLLAKAGAGATETLARYGIILDKNIPESKKFEAALDQIEKKMKGFSETTGKGVVGSMATLKNAFSNFMEGIGKVIAPTFEQITSEMKKTTESTRGQFTSLELGKMFAGWANEAIAGFRLMPVEFEKVVIYLKQYALDFGETVVGVVAKSIDAFKEFVRYGQSLPGIGEKLKGKEPEFYKGEKTFYQGFQNIDAEREALKRRLIEIEKEEIAVGLDLVAANRRTEEAYKSGAEQIEKNNEAQKESTQWMRGFGVSASQAEYEMKRHAESMGQNTTATQTAKQETTSLASGLAGLGNETYGLQGRISETSDGLSSLGSTISATISRLESANATMSVVDIHRMQEGETAKKVTMTYTAMDGTVKQVSGTLTKLGNSVLSTGQSLQYIADNWRDMATSMVQNRFVDSTATSLYGPAVSVDQYEQAQSEYLEQIKLGLQKQIEYGDYEQRQIARAIMDYSGGITTENMQERINLFGQYASNLEKLANLPESLRELREQLAGEIGDAVGSAVSGITSEVSITDIESVLTRRAQQGSNSIAIREGATFSRISTTGRASSTSSGTTTVGNITRR